MKENSLKILIIAYKFPPIKSVGALRNYHIAYYFQKHFDKTIVFTTVNRRILPKEILPDIPGIQTKELFTFDFKTIKGLSREARKYLRGEATARPVFKFLYKLKDSFPFNLFLDEGALLYILHGFWKGYRLIKKENVHYLYSSYRPYADHLIAYLLKRTFPSLFWIADFRDPHVDVNRKNVFFIPFQHWINKRILSRADLVSTISHGVAAYLGRYHPSVCVVRNGISRIIEPDNHNFESFSGKFIIVYTGTLYEDVQSASILFKALANLLESGDLPAGILKLVYSGNSPSIWGKWVKIYGLEQVSANLGELHLSRTLRLQQISHINLLLTWAGPFFTGILTAKLYEYLKARRPILAIINGDKDPELEKIVGHTGAGCVFYDSLGQVEKVEEFVIYYFKKWEEQRKVYTEVDPKVLEPYYWDKVFERFNKNL